MAMSGLAIGCGQVGRHIFLVSMDLDNNSLYLAIAGAEWVCWL